jgi:hypothetical protein
VCRGNFSELEESKILLVVDDLIDGFDCSRVCVLVGGLGEAKEHGYSV